MSLQIKQNSSYIGDRRWDWSIWLAGPADELDQVDHVTYTLHPTFPNPVREIRTRRGGFRLKSGGWGEFTIYIDIARKDGKIIQLSHDLKLTTEPAKRMKPDAANFSVAVAQGDSETQQVMPVIKGVAKEFYRSALDKAAEHLPGSTVFISGGVADAEAVRSLSKSLKKLNVRILSAEDIPSGVPFQIHIENIIDQANLVVFLVSGRPSMWMNQEIEAAKRRKKRIVPVLVGSESMLPETLGEFKSLRIDKMESVAALSEIILNF